ncbi:hypothetical protein MANES_13G018800v8 [Manihot esculenta]|uniref:Uncharacterized protein n=1 Tax=Manihot esculenta TaxID=3983 RepID=A0A2C9UP40_MANES|nr:hypothetical protein MANES_13G018800v8 [Manihot esculenta]
MESLDIVVVAISFLGFVSFCKNILKFLRWVWVMFLRPPKNLKESYGSWALITGCTDGIGKALAFELASQGLNLVLVGRNPLKLEATATEIRARNGKNNSQSEIKIKTSIVDLAKSSGEEISRAIEACIEGLDIGIVINNAGLAYPYSKFFHEIDLELMESIVKVNLEAATWVARSVIPLMLKKKKGAIVNIGSGSTVSVPSYPLNTVYASTKAYIAMLSNCMNLEYKNQGINVQCQIPLLVATKMTRLKKPNLLVASPEIYAKASIRWIGYEKLCSPFWSHSVQWFILQALPDALLNRFLFQYYLGLRNKGLKKEALRAKEKCIF